ncbi:ParB-like protein [Leptospira interrogans serovar Medanensis str. L0448]|nr:ParB-like protein [Leptospira interrogans str. UI 08452]EMN33208.1 ParB-like protein [Leptospira interrogans serovar Medanensis str. L0448]
MPIMQRYSDDFEISIDEIVPYKTHVGQRKIPAEETGVLANDMEIFGQINPITISSQKYKQEDGTKKYLIYSGERRFMAARALVKRGLKKYKNIRARTLINDSSHDSLMREVYGTNKDRKNWEESEIIDIIVKEYPKERFLKNMAGAPRLGQKKETPLADEISKIFAVSKATAYRYIEAAIEREGWQKQKNKPEYPLLASSEFSFAEKRAKAYNKALDTLNMAQKEVDLILKDVLDPKNKVMNRKEFEAFAKAVKNKTVRHI